MSPGLIVDGGFLRTIDGAAVSDANGVECCCGSGEPVPPLEDCPLGPFDFPAPCYSEAFAVSVSGIELKVCDGGDTCEETVSVTASGGILDLWQVWRDGTITGSSWTATSVQFACMPTDWADHPDGVSDYIMMLVRLEYDADGNPCGLDPASAAQNAYDFTLYLVSSLPRTESNGCIPRSSYIAFGWRTGLASEALEPTEDVGDCTDYEACLDPPAPAGNCIASVSGASVS